MSEPDPVMVVWHQVRRAEAAGCLDAGNVAFVAMEGLLLAPEAQQRHLLGGRCERCERVLRRTWDVRCPPPSLSGEAARWDSQSALGHALRTHVNACGAPGCAALKSALDPWSAPAETWAEVAMRKAGAALGEVFRPRLVGVLNDPDPHAGRAIPAGVVVIPFGDAIRMAALPAQRGQARLVVEFDHLPEFAGRDVVLAILREGDEDPVGSVTIANATGRQAVTLPLDAAVLNSSAVRVGIGPKTDG